MVQMHTIEMKTLLIKYGIYALLVFMLVGGGYKSCTTYKKQKAEIERLKNNQQALTTKLDTFKTESGKNAARAIEMEMKKSEFEELCSEQKKTIDDLKIKVKYLNGISTTASVTKVNFETVLKDSIIYVYKDSVRYYDKIKTFEWSDNWNKVNGFIYKDNIQCMYQGVDTVDIVITRIPHKFLFFKWGTKRIETVVRHSNPSSEIKFNQTIKISQ